jgi:hypothetical protein
MTQDIIEMARHIAKTFGSRMCDENGDTHGEELYAIGIDDIIETIKLVAEAAASKERKEFAVHAVDIARRAVAEEREACAKVCDEASVPNKGKLRNDVQWGAMNLADQIRARGEA